jgi:hypothetical protein
MRMALLIGIDDLTPLAQARGLSQAALNLRGACNDVHEHARLAERLGVEQVETLTSPSGQPTVTVDVLRAAIQRFARSLNGHAGTLVFCGHAEATVAGISLAASDGLVPLSWVRETLETLAPKRLLTVILDCCRTEQLDPVQARAALPDDLLLVAGPGAQERCFADGWHGAFSWALSQVGQQWSVRHGALEIGHQDWADRAGLLLSALAIPQTPLFFGPSDMAQLPVGAASVAQLGQVTQAPQVPALGREITSGNWELEDPNSEWEGKLVVKAGVGGNGFPDKSESWLGLDNAPDVFYAKSSGPIQQGGPGWTTIPQEEFSNNTTNPPNGGTYYRVDLVNKVGDPAPSGDPIAYMRVDGPEIKWFGKTKSSGVINPGTKKIRFGQTGQPGGSLFKTNPS